ncbi:hypothetical protein O181_017389 [Austropuccinia psidii MF-1]|uniref:Reverse transcriptase Ty1/copia-type domain-containing protein n=1 Tax=Austropuccinia psidii MF-1 TaxID=1389203 RepID=A0A9Q3C3C7_9BASI|nr:hypothetical protein [Austropuccinia psidii MF-1]
MINEPLPEPQLFPTANSTPESQELADEPQEPMSNDSAPQPALVDEPQMADDLALPYSNSYLACPPTCIKVIGPRHPTLFSSDINPNNILPYSRQAGALLMTLDDTPRTFNKAISCSSKEVWLEAINKELSPMKKLRVWDVVEINPMYKLTSGIDFDKTYSPTGRLNSPHTLIAFSASNGLLFHQINIKSAFLNAPLAKTFHLGIPQGLKEDRQKYCLRLNNAIYGLRQAPWAWYKRLKGWLTSIREVDSFKCQIQAEFEIKDIGQADLILGIKITQKEGSITLDQQHFAKSLLELHGMVSSQPALTPLIPNCHLEPAIVDEVEKFRALGVNYCSAIGSINYLSTATCPDLSFSSRTLSQFLENPGIKHWHGFLHVLCYLNGSQDLGLSYDKKGVTGIVAYSDADWGNCLLTCRLVTGYLACFNQCLVMWKTRKQPTVSLSMAEAEYKSLCDLTSELLWLSQWCQEAGLVSCNTPIPIHEDNQACINTANGNSNFNAKRMKHVDIQLHFVKQCIKSEKIHLVYTTTKDMLADFLTKSVPKPSLSQALDALGIFGLGVRGGAENQL